MEEPVVEPHSVKRSLDLFSLPDHLESKKIRMNYKMNAEYGLVVKKKKNLSQSSSSSVHQQVKSSYSSQDQEVHQNPKPAQVEPSLPACPEGYGDMEKGFQNSQLVPPRMPTRTLNDKSVPFESTSRCMSTPGSSDRNMSNSELMEMVPSKWPRPVWHAPWKNYRVISGHLGWVRSIAFDPSNSWFCTGSADRTIKIWDVGSGRLKLTLTGHIGQVRGLAVSKLHTYMFSAGDDTEVKCWDLEQNKVIRSFHGHRSGVYCLALHPTINILLTGGRDSVCRVWDIRSKVQIHALSGHNDTVCSIFTPPAYPQVVTGSHDKTIKLWDLNSGKTTDTLTHHKNSVRAMALHPKEHSFTSASSDNIKKFNLPRGEFLHNMLSQQKTIINSMTVNEDGVMATAGDNGSLWFWDWKSGHNFQQPRTTAQPGSLDCEAGIYALSYDMTGSRLVTCGADKTIKMWKEDENATPETHPLDFKPPKDLRRF